ncbi:hypothetical protein V495_03155 [Pseudogymnoascus sp. VKM F-4514 (FW-929)]|nr:hypothetical protein V495_03155 [Pseudogymnoascus sp. VKM F-4514 (FW-929)]KFY59004.1 hypothetical protein V497_04548 [Pseudogymnoascus sp. VKM F-4516 (FW-969)]
MQPLHAVFAIAVAFAVTFSNACLVFDAIYNIGTSKITGTMTDNGQKTCEFSGTVEKDKKSLYASCIDAHVPRRKGEPLYESSESILYSLGPNLLLGSR